MRLSSQRIKELQSLLKEQLDLVYTDEETQQAALAIMRFVVAKHQRNQLINHKESNNERRPRREKNIGGKTT